MSESFLSVIIPVYNKEKYLPDCLASVSDLCADNAEIVLVDDGSADRSAEICDAFAKERKNVRVIHQENRGSVAARNCGICAAHGEYLLFCDADDFYEGGAFDEIISILSDKKPDILVFNAYIVEKEGKKKRFSPGLFEDGFISDKNRIYDRFLLTYYLNSMCMKAVRRNLLKKSGNDDAFSGNYGDDFLESAPLYKKAASIYYVDRPLYNYRQDSGMMRKASGDYFEQYRKVNHSVGELLKEENIKDIRIKLAVHLLNAAYGAIIQYRYEKKTDRFAIRKISGDEEFRKAYTLVKDSAYKHSLSIKQWMILSGVRNRRFLPVSFLVSVRRIMDRLQ